MPTIQVRTDDKTKNASTAIFEQLGMTMSEAINLFLRQSIMRGGIPFTLTVSNIYETGIEIIENEALIDALRRYRTINGETDYDIAKTEPFINALNNLDSVKGIRFILQDKAVKARLNFKGNDFVLDYNFEEPDNVFILSRKNGKLIIKDCALTDINKTLERYK